jgi:hypothetical protein
MEAMRIQQELTARGFEHPRTPAWRSGAEADLEEARRFIARSLAWERRLQELRAASDVAAATTDTATTDTPVRAPEPAPAPATGPAARPATPALA